MNVLVLGAQGFVGAKTVNAFQRSGFEVWEADINSLEKDNNISVNLFDKESIKKVIYKSRPDYIINCAGVIDNSEENFSVNAIFTSNLLEVIKEEHIDLKKIIIIGSASEYGIVGKEGLPVNEEAPLLGKSFYAQGKILETSLALKYRDKYDLSVVVTRLFNPIGRGMNRKQLIPNILRQLKEVESGDRKNVEINRLDSERDYVNIKDVAEAFVLICRKDAKGPVYNIGSGKPTSNKTLVEEIIKQKNMKASIIKELQNDPEPIYATCADNSKVKKDTGWGPSLSLAETIGETLNG